MKIGGDWSIIVALKSGAARVRVGMMVAATVVFMVGPASTARAQDKGGAAEAVKATEAADKSAKAPARKGPQKVTELVLEQKDVVGKVQKPRVFILIGRGELKYKGLSMDRSLLKEIEESAEGAPF